MQTNHFAEAGTGLTASVARIPWLGTAFPGFIAGLWHRGRLYRFATYTGAALRSLAITDTNVHVSLQDRRFRL
jgi:tocopherol cyclase